jgi:predicted signal transduction protein with EAL and GGDEF domain
MMIQKMTKNQKVHRAIRLALFIGCILMILGISFLDYLSKWEISFSIFYLLPIFLVTWYWGKRFGIAFALICAIAWFMADYLVSESYLHPLVPYWNSSVRLIFFMVTVFLISKHKRELEREKKMARIDSLSGLLNNGSFSQVAKIEIERSKRYGHPLSIIFLDLDNFKKVNDTLGHINGDKIIKRVGSVIRKNIRTIDYASRPGGDEFILLLPEADEYEAGAYV